MASKTFGGISTNPVSGISRRTSSPVMNIFFLGSTNRALAYQRSLIAAKYLSKSKSANCGVMFGRFTKEVIDWADIVVFQRVGGRVIENLATYCRKKGIAVIYDMDDDVFNYPEAKEYESSDLGRVYNDVTNMMSLSDCVIVTEESIRESARSHVVAPIYVVPNYIDVEVWDEPKKKNYNNPDFIIGWAGGHYHSEDLKIIEEPIKIILRKYPNIKFATIGAKIDSLFDEFGSRIFYHDFVDVADYPELMHRMKFSIGLAPLSHSKFSDARSNIRLLQYSLLEIPTIASCFGPYARSYDDGFPVVAVNNTTEAWVQALCFLIDNDTSREYYGKASREAVVSKYRAERLVPKYMDIFRIAKELSLKRSKK